MRWVGLLPEGANAISNEELTAPKEQLSASPPREQVELAKFLEEQAAGAL
jgi:hypothetical protein